MNIKNQLLVRVYLVGVVLLVIGLVIMSQTAKIQWMEGDRWLSQRDSQWVRLTKIVAERGDILSKDGQQLATSLTFFDIFMDPGKEVISDHVFDENIDSLAYCLSRYVDPSKTPGGHMQYLREMRDNGRRYVPIKSNVSILELEKIRSFPIFDLGRHRGGLIVKRRVIRHRPYGKLGQRTVGYLKKDGSALVGIEGSFDEYLRGEEGVRVERKMIPSTWVPVHNFSDIEPEKGEDLTTTIDVDLQDMVHQELSKSLQYHQAKSGCAILMKVQTGEILAISNLTQGKDEYYEGYNYAVGTALEPGSTFKTMSMMAMMEDGELNLNDSIDLEKGNYEIHDRIMKDASFHELENVTIQKAFSMSSNVGIAKLIMEKFTGRETAFVNRLRRFGLDEICEVNIKGEGKPKIKRPEITTDNWSGTTLPWMSIGYELTLTPLQILAFYNGIANGGEVMRPKLIKNRMVNEKIIKAYKPEVLRYNIASDATLNRMKDLLNDVVQNGTAESCKSDLISFAGKTGTAILGYNDKVKKREYMASFAGYFPSENPEYSAIVVVYNPKEHGYYGSQVAAPVFKRIAEKTYESKVEIRETKQYAEKNKKAPVFNMGNTKDIEGLFNHMELPFDKQTRSSWAVTVPAADSVAIKKREIVEEKVPNVVGMGLRDALFVLEKAGLNVMVRGNGKVLTQSLPPGAKSANRKIVIRLG